MEILNLYTSQKISPREKQVLHLIAHERNTKEIAHELFVSYEPSHSPRKNLLRKINVKKPACRQASTAGLIRVAFEKGIFQSMQFQTAQY